MERICVICGKKFNTPPSNNKITCSKVCSKIRKQQAHKGISNEWGKEAREKLSLKGQTGNLKMGTVAAKQSPIAGRFETNQEAKIWVLIDPVGREYRVRNLMLWARKNAERFGKEPDNDRVAIQISSGFRRIAMTMRGTREKPIMTYMGWTLKKLPEKPQPD